MPPFIVAAIIAGVAALAYNRRATNPAAPVVVQTTPASNPPGIIGSFAAPPIAVSVDQAGKIQGPPVSQIQPHQPVQTNTPGTSASGVPVWSSNAQEFNDGYAMASPAPGTRIPGFYTGPIHNNIRTRFRPVAIPKPAKSTECSCGGSCGTASCANASDCASAKARNRDGGCLAPTRKAQLQSAGAMAVLRASAANLASSGVTDWMVVQQNEFDQQETNPLGFDQTVPATPFVSRSIGISPDQPLRTAFAANN